jgi:hypothetical protein
MYKTNALSTRVSAGRKLHRPTMASSSALCSLGILSNSSTQHMPPSDSTMVYRRNLNLKAKFQSSLSYFSLKRLVPSAFEVGLIGSTCTVSLSCRRFRSGFDRVNLHRPTMAPASNVCPHVGPAR